MRTITIAILGAPFAAWALHGCLILLGAPEGAALIAGAAWGTFWLVAAHLGPNARFLRRRRGDGSRGIPGGRGVWTGAVLGSLLLPIPVVAIAVLLEWLDLAAPPLTLPLLAILALPVPGAMWWMLLFPGPAHREGDIVRPPGWRRFTPHVPSRVIPSPRTTDRGQL